MSNETPIKTETRRAPVDYDAVKKGSFIGAEEVERVTGTRPDNHRDYQFALLGLKHQIETETSRRGNPVVIKVEGQGLRVLTDAEAVAYADQRHRNLTGQMLRNHVRSVAAIDPRQLTADQLRRHERDVIARSRELQAVRDTRRQLRVAEQKQLPNE